MSEHNQPQGEDTIASRLAQLESDPQEEVTEPTQEEEATPTSEENEENQESLEDSQEQEPESEESQDLEEEGLPEDSSERTRKAFERLTENNRKLKEQLEARQPQDTPGSVYDSIYGRQAQQAMNANNYQNLNQGQVNNIAQQFIVEDPNTGERSVDVEGLVTTLAQENQRTVQQADQRIRQYEETRQVAEAHEKHPYLDPQNKEAFDPVFYDIVRVKALDNLVQGQSKTLSQIAEESLAVYTPASAKPNVAKERKEAVESYKQAQTVRQSAAPINKGKGAPRAGVKADYEVLRAKTRSNNVHESDNAIIDRLKRAL